jgi:hypothetical protein
MDTEVALADADVERCYRALENANAIDEPVERVMPLHARLHDALNRQHRLRRASAGRSRRVSGCGDGVPPWLYPSRPPDRARRGG